MSLADEFRQIADECRSIPNEFGLREHAVTLVRNYWTGGRPGDGDEVSSDTPITVSGGANPKVRFPSQREIALGLMSEGQVTIGPFTPEYGVGGIDRTLFDGSQLSTGDGLFLRLTGPQHPEGVLYRIKNCNVDQALRVTLVCVPVTPR